MLTLRLAFRNIIGAGLRTWLNVFVLSLAFVAIIWTKGLIDGMNEYAVTSKIDAEYGGGQFWQKDYDPHDPLTIEDSHAQLSPELEKLIQQDKATPILITSSAIYPQGRIQSALLKGIQPGQRILDIPSHVVKSDSTDGIPGLIGERMAKQTDLQKGDYVTVRWRDVNGTFDATDIQIAGIMNTPVPTIDNGQIWISLENLQKMLQMPNQATIVVLEEGIKKQEIPSGSENWVYRDLDYLLKDIRAIVESKNFSMAIMFLLLLGMGLLAIFDTQVLAVFRRKKEIGTMIALGMTRKDVITLFTLEGALHGLLALLVGAIYGIPLLWITAKYGIPMPEALSTSGFTVSSALYPSYGFKLVLGTTLLVLITVTIVSFLPTRKIAHLNPTDAIRGREGS